MLSFESLRTKILIAHQNYPGLQDIPPAQYKSRRSEFLAYGSGEKKNVWIGPNIAANVSSMTKLIYPHHDTAWPARPGLSRPALTDRTSQAARIAWTDRFQSDIPRRTGMTSKQRFDRLPSQYFDFVWYISIELIKDWEGSPRNFIDSVQKHRTAQISLLNKKNFICVRYLPLGLPFRVLFVILWNHSNRKIVKGVAAITMESCTLDVTKILR